MFRNRGELCSIMSLPFCVTGIEWALICDLVYIIMILPPCPPPPCFVCSGFEGDSLFLCYKYWKGFDLLHGVNNDFPFCMFRYGDSDFINASPFLYNRCRVGLSFLCYRYGRGLWFIIISFPFCITGIEGDFDLCQTMVKKAFQDQNLATWLSENGNFRLRYRK